MAHYDDWIYERGLENEDWVHDRWGDNDDWDDDYDDWSDNNNLEGEDEDMEQINNRISFVKDYTDSEKLAIDTKISRILKEFSNMKVGPCAFRLNDEVMCVYCVDSFSYNSEKTMGFTFKYRDYDENKLEYKNGHYDTYSAKSLFITKYESEIKQELLEARKTFDESEKSMFDITYTREDGIKTILQAKEAGVNIDIAPYLELSDLTDDEIRAFIEHGYGYDVYLKEGVSYEIKEYISHIISNIPYSHIISKNPHGGLCSGKAEKLNAWIEKNPDKCILPENRHPELVEAIEENEDRER